MSRATSVRRPSRSRHDELRERMSGNVCRCGAYNGIVAAIAETFEEEPT
jgi:xanthine dehydrogenase YagT iron-sulfur-binding subunit